ALEPVWRERLARLLRSPATAPATARLLRAADYRVQSVPLEPAAARTLFNDHTLSVSRLEEFAACPFRHFVDYGLRPEIIKDWGVEPVDLGVLYHRSLQNFAAVAALHPSYPNVTPKEAETMADEAVAPLMERLLRGPMGDTARSLADFTRARRVIRRACVTVTQQLAAGDFTLVKAEARFGYAEADSLPPVPLRLQDGTEVLLQGKIDRIDRYTAPDATYLRVIDYKSGQTTLEPTKTWWGLQLQLMVYLDAAISGTPGTQPAGAFYFHVADPLAKLDTDDPAQAENEIAKQLQMKGVALADENVLSAMDRGDTALVIPAALAKGGGVRKDARVLAMPQMRALLRRTRVQATTLAEALYDGDTSILPAVSGAVSSCETCDYQAVCGFDSMARGAKAREFAAMNMEELTQLLSDAPASPQDAAGG
ncbi:MAG: PD-(D/E)XK nuclease family protein, partial [Eubacteriales bacterium]|nr:PD-(D/E)XK nuclease family protein [Eubacteriales bacterium]